MGPIVNSNKLQGKGFPTLTVLTSLVLGFLLGRMSSSSNNDDGRMLRLSNQNQIVPITTTQSELPSLVGAAATSEEASSTETTTSEAATTTEAVDETTTTTATTGPTTTSTTRQQQQQQRNFYEIAVKHGADKALGPSALTKCHPPDFADPSCPKDRQTAGNPSCRVVGHFYHKLYQQWLGPLSYDDTDPFLLIELGFGLGRSVPVWQEFLPAAERHTIDIACQDLEAVQPQWIRQLYEPQLAMGKLHCGSSADYDFLQATYDQLVTNKPEAERLPLRVVVEDASHIPAHMAAAIFFWLPRIEPGGLLILEDIEPNVSLQHGGHKIQSDFLPQLLSDVHWCGDVTHPEDPPCFPTIQPLIESVHCSLHICVIERNTNVPASNPPKDQSIPPPNALDLKQCLVK